jgi:hypothetical protein
VTIFKISYFHLLCLSLQQLSTLCGLLWAINPDIFNMSEQKSCCHERRYIKKSLFMWDKFCER